MIAHRSESLLKERGKERTTKTPFILSDSVAALLNCYSHSPVLGQVFLGSFRPDISTGMLRAMEDPFYFTVAGVESSVSHGKYSA